MLIKKLRMYKEGDDTTYDLEIGVGVINKDGETIIPDKYNAICSLLDMDTFLKLLGNK